MSVLGGLVPDNPTIALGLLLPVDEDFCDFRQHGDRMRIEDLDAPSGVFVPRAFPSVNTEGELRHLGHRAVAPPRDQTGVFYSAPGDVPNDIIAGPFPR